MSTLTAEPEAAPSLREQKKAHTRQALHAAAARLVEGPGLAAVTVEEICAAAQVSPRTFFNYYPSKAAAVLGLPDSRIRDAARDAFLDGRGNVARDLCDLVASMLDGAKRPDKAMLHELLQRHPELQPELHGWLAGLRRALLDLVEQRATAQQASAALALVMAAVAEAARRDEPQAATGDRLWRGVQEMVAVALAS